jgi:acyl-coenzyme A synthetase/AMP-(fatty) acid ligase
MSALPLLHVSGPEQHVAWRNGQPVSAAQFVTDVRALGRQLPPGRSVLNLCADRYLFAVGFAAALISGRSTLLPSSIAPLAIAKLRQSTPDLFCLMDAEGEALGLPHVRVCTASPATGPFEIPCIDENHPAAWVFTSGSTGAPVGHRKTWGGLVRCLRAGAKRLGLDARPVTIVATVPPQHMYGFELSVLLPWVAGHAASAERPLHAAEVAAALLAVPSPRVLVTTPLHLRALLASTVEFPPVELLVSATAPLTPQLARDSELRFGAPLREIYGSTETGEMAMRRTARERSWELWPDVTIALQGDGFVACGGHIETPTPLQDVVVPLDERHFLLEGRRSDLVNIAGKRSSLSYLNHQLAAINGVVDGTFVIRAEQATDNGAVRLAAIVCAPGRTTRQLLDELRLRVDAAFLPRPLLLVERLPRNEAGKLPLAAVEQLLVERGRLGRSS